VSTADIAASIEAAIAQPTAFVGSEEVGRVVLTAEDVRIIGEGEEGEGVEGDRIKRLGEFGVEIQVRGGEVIRRAVRVKAVQG
jgi:hypothetical protein